MEAPQESKSTWLDRPILTNFTLNWEVVIFSIIVLLFVITRFYDLESRVMSHDESLHTYYSWLLSEGRGFTHTPLMHGPLQFHLVALSYFLFGDNDLTARLPAVLASILSVVLLWNYRRYLGRAGTLIAATLFLISPFLLYYGRYVRNEAFIVPLGLLTIWAILRYLETGRDRYLFYLTAATALHFTIKETAFIYTAQALLFLGIYFVHRITRQTWKIDSFRKYFLIALIIALILAGAGIGSFFLTRGDGGLSATETATPLVPDGETSLSPLPVPSALTISLLIFAGLAGLAGLYFLIRGFTWRRLRFERSFNILITLVLLTLPWLAPFPERFIGWDPLDYSDVGRLRTGAFLVPLFLISGVIGLLWNPRLFVINTGIFYAIFIVFYTTVFTNGGGFFTGIVGSLGYWLEQQGVRRGSQPFYYYYLIQIPIYEYLAAFGSFLALVLGIRIWWTSTREKEEDEALEDSNEAAEVETHPEKNEPPPDTDTRGWYETWTSLWSGAQWRAAREKGMEDQNQSAPALLLIGFWAVTSLIAYTIAGEKMPWLTVHIAWPMILLSGWALGQLVESTDWAELRQKRIFLVVAVMVIFFTSLMATIATVAGTNPPFAGSELDQLQATSTFLFSALTALISGIGLYFLLQPWNWGQIGRVATLIVFALLGLLTARSAFTATYINFDEGTEYLVYAHGARGVKEVMEQVEEISKRTTDGLALQVGYDNDVSWPMTWYLRNYDNQRYYGENPTRDLRDLPVIMVGDDHFGEIEPIVGQAFHEFEYIRMVWPDQDYFNLTPSRILGALTDPALRRAIFKIWLNRDFSEYAEIKGRDNLEVSNWSPSDRMRLYIRRDIAASLWNYGVGPTAEEVIADPYEDKQIEIVADRVIGNFGTEPGQFNAPRGVVIAPDGSLFVTDSNNHRIQHISSEGEVLAVWGEYGETTEFGLAPEGSFNEPWGIALGPDGSIYVADTWNHRVQKFSSEGEFITAWGFFGQAEDGYAFWGPRDVAVDPEGRVLVTDTGNKRVVVFDEDGTYLTEVGISGFGLGEFNEPVGVSIDDQGFFYVADTWNQRIQMLNLADNNEITPITTWDVVGWYGQSLENKPYLTVDASGRLFVADPEGARILEFTADGEFVRFWGEFSVETNGFNLPIGISVDPDGGVWVADSGNNRVMRFTLPPVDSPEVEE